MVTYQQNDSYIFLVGEKFRLAYYGFTNLNNWNNWVPGCVEKDELIL